MKSIIIYVPTTTTFGVWAVNNPGPAINRLCAGGDLTGLMYRSDAVRKALAQADSDPALLLIHLSETVQGSLMAAGLLSGHFESGTTVPNPLHQFLLPEGLLPEVNLVLDTGIRCWVLKAEALPALGELNFLAEALEVPGSVKPDANSVVRGAIEIYALLPAWQGRQFVDEPMRAFTRTFAYCADRPMPDEVISLDTLIGFKQRQGAIETWIKGGRCKPSSEIAILHMWLKAEVVTAFLQMEVLSGDAINCTSRAPLWTLSQRAYDLLLNRGQFFIEFVSGVAPYDQQRLQPVRSFKP